MEEVLILEQVKAERDAEEERLVNATRRAEELRKELEEEVAHREALLVALQSERAVLLEEEAVELDEEPKLLRERQADQKGDVSLRKAKTSTERQNRVMSQGCQAQEGKMVPTTSQRESSSPSRAISFCNRVLSKWRGGGDVEHVLEGSTAEAHDHHDRWLKDPADLNDVQLRVDQLQLTEEPSNESSPSDTPLDQTMQLSPSTMSWELVRQMDKHRRAAGNRWAKTKTRLGVASDGVWSLSKSTRRNPNLN